MPQGQPIKVFSSFISFSSWLNKMKSGPPWFYEPPMASFLEPWIFFLLPLRHLPKNRLGLFKTLHFQFQLDIECIAVSFFCCNFGFQVCSLHWKRQPHSKQLFCKTCDMFSDATAEMEHLTRKLFNGSTHFEIVLFRRWGQQLKEKMFLCKEIMHTTSKDPPMETKSAKEIVFYFFCSWFSQI